MSGEVRNDRSNAVTKFCLVMEEHRRTEAGRVRTAREMLDVFFPRANGVATDRLFFHIPPETRGPILSGWGIRGPKTALRDTDEKTREAVQDALAAGDIDESTFERGVAAQTLIDWIPLTEWWGFWRSGKLTGVAVQKALATGRELGLFDDRWFLGNVDGRGGKLKGTDTLCDSLSKDQIVAWLRKVHESGDGSPAGLVKAIGWETILTKTSQEALLFALDALASKINLVGLNAPTEMPRAPASMEDVNVAVPPAPGVVRDRDPRSALENQWATESAALTGAAPVSTPWPDTSGEGGTQDEVPPSIRLVDDDADKPKIQPPPVPASRKRV